jgi:ATP-binding cassette subfamily C protein
MNAHRILVIQGGRLVQSGNYQELIQQPGMFADMAKRQLA